MIEAGRMYECNHYIPKDQTEIKLRENCSHHSVDCHGEGCPYTSLKDLEVKNADLNKLHKN